MMITGATPLRLGSRPHEISILGIAVAGERIELHGLNDDGDVVLQGWFPLVTGVTMLSTMHPCHVALGAGNVSDEFAATLSAMGFAASAIARPRRLRRLARRSAATLATALALSHATDACSIVANARTLAPTMFHA